MAKKAGELRLKWLSFALCIALVNCGGSAESRLRKTLATQITGLIQLPGGVIEVSSELRLAPGAHDLEIAGAGTLFKAAKDFKGRAIFVAENARAIRFHDFSIDGNRVDFDQPIEMAPSENAFRIFYSHNGIVVDQVEGVEISELQFAAIPGFAVIASRSSKIRIKSVLVEDSGTRNAKGRNNTTGGILIEEGSSDFEVRNSRFLRIRGNALWTHSLYTSPRLHDGLFAANRFESIGRDAIEVGAASNIRVEDNTGDHIGYPPEAVDIENLGTPVAMDTAGNVDHSTYARNTFEEIDGKCIDLDGFHDGAIEENGGAGTRPLTVTLSGAATLNQTVTTSETDDVGYTAFTFGFVSTGGNVTLSFVPSDYSAEPNFMLDNVSVMSAPEPSYGLAGLGALMVIALKCKKNF